MSTTSQDDAFPIRSFRSSPATEEYLQRAILAHGSISAALRVAVERYSAGRYELHAPRGTAPAVSEVLTRGDLATLRDLLEPLDLTVRDVRTLPILVEDMQRHNGSGGGGDLAQRMTVLSYAQLCAVCDLVQGELTEPEETS